MNIDNILTASEINDLCKDLGQLGDLWLEGSYYPKLASVFPNHTPEELEDWVWSQLDNSEYSVKLRAY